MMKNNKLAWIVIGVVVLCILFFIIAGGVYILTSSNSPIRISVNNPSETPITVFPSNTPWIQPTYTQLPTYTPQPTFTNIPTLPPTYTPFPTYTKEPTYTPVTEALFTANQPAYCRSGPSDVIWWDPKEALNEGQTVRIIGKSTSEWGLWWLIQKPSGTKCWVYSDLGSTSGNVAGVPVVQAPNTPTPTILTVTIKNNHLEQLCNIWIENAGANNWIDLLEGNPLDPGSKVSFTAFPGWYDLEVYNCSGVKVDAAYNFEIRPDKVHFKTP